MYLASMVFHPKFTLFTYAPRLGTWFWGVPDLARNGPGMYWYSWLATGLIAGFVAAFVWFVVPSKPATWIGAASTWVLPLLLTTILLYVERTWFGFK